jgi:alpha-beta hydrolase superfamily lysophospholipase
MTHRESQLTGAGGLRIFWQAWLPDGEPSAVIVIAPGASEHSDRYLHVATRLVDDGYAVYAIEHRGHGRSDGPPALIDRIDNAVADLDQLILAAAAEHPSTQIFLLGHSMGGAIAVSYAMRHQQRLAGLLLSAPLAALDAAPAHMRVAAKVLSVLAPKLPLVEIDATLVSRDPAVVKAYVEDPMVHHGKLPVRTVSELAAAIDTFPDGVKRITVPALIMYGTADRLCPPEGSVMLADRIGSSDLTTKAYDGLYHEILNEPEQVAVLNDMSAWLAARVATIAA